MDNSNLSPKRDDSPCVRNCCLDENDVCLGCFRHLSEITAWRDLSPIQQKDVMEVCNFRRQEHQSTHRPIKFI